MNKGALFIGIFLFTASACTAQWIIPEGYIVECTDNSDCPDTAECTLADDGQARVCVTAGETWCGNGVQEVGEACDDGDNNTGEYGTSARCNLDCSSLAPHCGDGEVNGGEECDNGEGNDNLVPDACRENCISPRCSDGVVDSGEACDNAEANTDSYGEIGRCNTTCDGAAPSCGDSTVNGGEACDSGDSNSEEYGEAGRCNSSCNGTAPHCGDGEQNGGELCDNGAANSDAYGTQSGCLINCSGPPAYCGDQLTNGAESCDDGNTDNGDYCSSNCLEVTTICGDGQIQGDEVCDDGAANTNDHSGAVQACNALCSGLAPYCGDGASNSQEYNDSLTSRQLCNAACSGYRAHCGDGVVEPDGVENCDDGNDDGGDYCGKDCLSFCGDGIVDGVNFETCDDGNGVLTDACPDGENGTCRIAECGDGYVFNGGGEDCEPSLEQAACSSIASMYQAGNVSCSGECRFDFSTCFNDPDHMVEGMVYVPPGAFWMGCNEEVDSSCGEDEYSYHEVYLDGFYIDTTEVTAGAYKACVDAGSCTYGGSTTDEMRTYNNGRDDHPINYVNHTEAKTYCEAQDKRLPTEAEWEKAARGTDERKYPWGNEAPTCDLAVMFGCPGDTQPVGSLNAGASPYGAMDMAGNLREWMADWFSSSYYAQTPAGGWVNPEGPDSASSRVLRGGSFYVSTYYLRASDRDYGNPGSRGGDGYGFRCAQ